MYCERQQLSRVYGNLNIDRWADINNNGDSGEIAERITYFLEQATAYIDGRLADSAYTFPITGENVPTVISHATALYAGIKLYEGRRVVQDETDTQTSAQEKEFEDIIKRILSDTLKLPLQRTSTKPPKIHNDPETTNGNSAYDSAFSAPC